MISFNKELFLFEKPVPIINDRPEVKEVEGFEIGGTGTGYVEEWLSKVEESMQSTMKKQMQYAVKSFATRALDEWILDYPQQVIITSLGLILTNEINDILDEKHRQKEKEDAEGSEADMMGENQDDGGAPDDDEEENNDDNESKEGEQDANKEKKKNRGQAQLKISAEEKKKRLYKELFGSDFVPDERFTKALDQAIDDIRVKRLQMTQAAAAQGKATQKKPLKNTHKDHVIELLGQQSFYGVFLRIHFWINKIVKSLYDQKKVDWQDLECELQLTGV